MNSLESTAVFAITSTVIFSFVYFFILDKLESNDGNKVRSRIISIYIWRKLSGFILFGVVTAILALAFFKVRLPEYGLTIGSSLEFWPWLILASAFFILLNLFNSRNPEIREKYPEMRLQTWNYPMMFLAATGWVIYLAGYEFLFRGLLLFGCYNAFGYWPAIVINLALYAALHLPKGLKEATATIPFGILICYLTLETHSILPAILIHSLQAVSCEISCLWRNPDMKFNILKN
jgi:membrane protease YdiL (CAAX protease family)